MWMLLEHVITYCEMRMHGATVSYIRYFSLIAMKRQRCYTLIQFIVVLKPAVTYVENSNSPRAFAEYL